MSIQTKPKSKFKPSDVDLSDGLQSTYGIVEYEKLAVKIIEWLVENGDNWDTWFRTVEYRGWLPDSPIDPYIPGLDTVLFTMFCASGWISNQWFPKGAFIVSQGFVDQLKKRSKYKDYLSWYNRKR